MDKREFEAEGDRLVALADGRGVALRLLGALAFAKRCPRHAYLQETLKREYTDIDFAGYGKQASQIKALLPREGYVEDTLMYVESEGSRMVLNHPVTGLHLDVFLDKLAAENGCSGLSMGMSDDFETAVQFGATYVRVGSAIFGSRANP